MKSKLALFTLVALLMSAPVVKAASEPGTEINKVWFNHEWTNYTKTTQEFDTDGSGKCLVTIQHNYKYSFALGKYVELTRTLLFHDGRQLLIRELSQQFDQATKSFVDASEITYTYTREGLLQSATARKVNFIISPDLVGTTVQAGNDSRTIGSNDRWMNVSLKLYTHSNRGLLTQYIMELWNPYTKDYEPAQQEFYYYDRNDQLLTTLRQSWKFDSRRWVNGSKEINTYVGALLVKSAEYVFNSEQSRWINTENTLNDYDIDLRLIVITTQALKPSMNQFRTVHKTELTYDFESGNVILKVDKKLNEVTGRLQNHMQTQYSEFCGSITSSIREQAENMDELSQMVLFPNPGKQLFIKANSSSYQAIEVRIMSNDGKLVKSFLQKLNAGENNYELDTADLNDGLYIVQMITDTGTINKNWLKK
jgi:hypothetical protein